MMKITVKFYSASLLGSALLGLAGCAPMMPEPVYVAEPAPVYGPPGEPVAQPYQQYPEAPAYTPPPQYYQPPPAVNPVEDPRQQAARPYQSPREPMRPYSPSGTRTVQPPTVTYRPEPASPRTNKKAQVETKPFWDEGKVEVEVLDMKKMAPTASRTEPSKRDTGNVTTTVTPLQRSTPSSGEAASKTSTITSPSSVASASPSYNGSNPAIAVLLKQSNNELAAGNTARAASTLERALRIAPDDANLWLRLAEINEQQGNKRQAASMAQKALNLAPEDNSILQRTQRLMN